ncbi:Uncharacterised protein [Burkholderia pseudomallei]|nr:Uncharacterised protein [Burkholderia pseudomallei]CAJ4734501.1 Uncharacterised protein [Burkholderia pseudomallei]CAJ7349351.1 Uncharacterised protein [Burkholderia pseudomallei]
MDNKWQALEIVRIAFGWLGVAIGHAVSSITLSGIALVITSIYSGLSAYVLVRDKILSRREGEKS